MEMGNRTNLKPFPSDDITTTKIKSSNSFQILVHQRNIFRCKICFIYGKILNRLKIFADAWLNDGRER